MRDDLAFALEEFRVLRSEISQRSAAQSSSVQLNLTGTAAIVGACVAAFLDVRILLVIPVVSPGLGLLWLDHAKAIERQGLYIRDVLAPAFSASPETAPRSYEAFVREAGADRRGLYNASLTLGIFGLFFIVPVIAFAAALLAPTPPGQRAVSLAFAAIAALILTLYIVDFCRWMIPRTWPHRP